VQRSDVRRYSGSRGFKAGEIAAVLSFGRFSYIEYRVGRAATTMSEAATALEFIPAEERPVELAALFGRRAPLEVDLGCGDGSFLVALAAQHPECNYLGIEKLFGRTRTSCKRIERAGLANVRVGRVDIIRAVTFLLSPKSVDVFYIMFPDPWPKRRHERRRVVTLELLESIAKALVTKGVLHLATDQREYFEQMLRISGETQMFEKFAVEGTLPRTTFEQRFLEAGAPIYRLGLRKLSEPR